MAEQDKKPWFPPIYSPAMFRIYVAKHFRENEHLPKEIRGLAEATARRHVDALLQDVAALELAYLRAKQGDLSG